MFKVDFKGLDEIEKALHRLAKVVAPGEIEKDLYAGADIITQEVRRRAKQGPTGNLKKGAVTKVLRRLNPSQPAPVISAMDYNIAPHYHLIEKGTKERTPRTKKVMYNKQTGKVFGVKARGVEKAPFFEPSVEAKMNAATTEILNRLGKRIDEAVK